MSAERLREAATLMREQAISARAGIWFATPDGVEIAARWADPRSVAVAYGSEVPEGNIANAAHIASWHPAVALAVADWLQWTADAESMLPAGAQKFALVVADAYLGESS